MSSAVQSTTTNPHDNAQNKTFVPYAALGAMTINVSATRAAQFDEAIALKDFPQAKKMLHSITDQEQKSILANKLLDHIFSQAHVQHPDLEIALSMLQYIIDRKDRSLKAVQLHDLALDRNRRPYLYPCSGGTKLAPLETINFRVAASTLEFLEPDQKSKLLAYLEKQGLLNDK